MICFSLTGGSLDEDLALITGYGSDIPLFELRLDFIKNIDPSAAAAFPRRTAEAAASRTPPRIILTLRRKKDGGQYSGSEEDRAGLLSAVLSAGKNFPFHYVDLEEDFHSAAVEAGVRKSGVSVIRSFHDFEGVPPDLTDRVRRLARGKEEIPKAAVYPRGSRDLLRFFQAAAELRGIKKILLAMGPFGLPSRILTAKTGSYLSFCSRSGASAAPGHLSPEELIGLYRHSKVRAETPVFAVIGNPVMHSRSPAYHNLRFSQDGIDAVYVPFLVDDTEAFFRTADLIDMRGISVTIPHKQAVIRHTNEREESVERLSACNTLLRRSSGWYGCNTDVEGFLGPLRRCLDSGPASGGLSGKKACVIGAGGAARAVVYALLWEGMEVCILNRTEEKARGLAEEFGDIGPAVNAGGLDARGMEMMKAHSFLIVQTTSVGMHPCLDADPAPGYVFSGNEIVYDIIYNPEITRFLTRAREAGSQCIGGMEMFNEQARLQYQLFREAARRD